MKARTFIRTLIGAGASIFFWTAAFAQLVPVAWWRFDESSGTTASDSAGSYTGTLQGGATFVSGGISGKAIGLDETSGSYVDMGTSFPGFTSGDFSFSVWIKTDQATGQILSKHRSGSVNGYFLTAGDADSNYGSPNKAWLYGSNEPHHEVISTSSVNNNTWRHVVATYGAGSMQIYIDGAWQATQNSHQILGNDVSFLVGGLYYSGGTVAPTFTGLIDDLQVYGAALSDAQVSWLHSNPGQAIPEPSTYAALAGLGALGFALRRRQRGHA